MSVKEIDKPLGVTCSKVCDQGCSIYESRPSRCRAFNCLWLTGLGSEEERPDTTGVVFDSDPDGTALIAYEAWEGAFKDTADLTIKRCLKDGGTMTELRLIPQVNLLCWILPPVHVMVPTRTKS